MKARSLPTLRIIVLAAGFSARLGQPKALARVHGLTLLRRTLRVLAPFAASSKIIVVIPPAAGRYKIASDAHSAAFVANSQRASGPVELGAFGAASGSALRRSAICSRSIWLTWRAAISRG
jgi:CTP:molybdopterin cytidylyltransferase MocA